MLWKKTTTEWPVDPSRVEYGSIADKAGRNCSRTHLLVQYSADTRPHLVPLNRFVRETSASLRHGQELDIQFLRVAPVSWRRYRGLFDRLTDWLPAARLVTQAGGRVRPDPAPVNARRRVAI
jgi:hypothetical protein